MILSCELYSGMKKLPPEPFGAVPANYGHRTYPPQLQTNGCPPSPYPSTIRPARQEDANSLTELLTRSFYSSVGWTGLVYPLIWIGVYEDLRTRLKSSSTCYACLVSVQSGRTSPSPKTPTSRLTGTVEISLRAISPWQPHIKRLYISNLAVCQEYRRQGIARNLLNNCDRLAKEWGFQEIYLHVLTNNTKARRLYVKAGYELVKAEINWRSLLLGQPHQLLLRKDLG